MWRGVVNATAQVQYALCFEGVEDGCWYDGTNAMPFLSGPPANQPAAARLGKTNVRALTNCNVIFQ